MCDCNSCNPIELTRGPVGPQGATGPQGPQGPVGPVPTNVWIYGGNTVGDDLHTIGTADNHDFLIISNGAERMRILKSGLVGIGTPSPMTGLEVAFNNANAFIVSTRYSSDAFSPGFISRKSRGTISAPSAILSGDKIADFAGAGYHSGNAFGQAVGEFKFYAAENFTNTNQGTNAGIFVAAKGTTTTVEKFTVTSEGNVGIGNPTPSASTALDITSTTGALLLPRMTTAQKNALTPINGMLIYDTNLNKFQGYENGAWTNLI